MTGRDADTSGETGDGDSTDSAGENPNATGDGDENGYVHTPGPSANSGGEGDRTTAAYLAGEAGEAGDGADWRAWLLVAATFVAFLVVPAIILLLPAARPVIAALGLSYRDAYLVLPLVPAIGLASLAVWAGVANRRDR